MKKKISQRDQYWLNHIKNFENSGITAVQYCKNHQINYRSFTSKKSQLVKTKETITPVCIDKVLKPISSKITIKINSNIELSFDSLPEPAWLAQTISKIGLNDASF